jgi:hypothetical protein
MPTMTMTVRYVNPPKAGKQRGSIKGTDDQILGVFADKLHLFEPGSTYDIEYTETVSSGVTYRNVKSVTAVAAAPTASTGPTTATHNTYRETSANDAKRMFVCANLSWSNTVRGSPALLSGPDLRGGVTDRILVSWTTNRIKKRFRPCKLHRCTSARRVRDSRMLGCSQRVTNWVQVVRRGP